MKSILLTTTSQLKLRAVKNIFPSDKFEITTIKCDECGFPSHPYKSGGRCAKARLDYAAFKTFPQIFDYIISIENGIEKIHSCDGDIKYIDVCHVIIKYKGLISHSVGSIEFVIPQDKMFLLKQSKKYYIPELKIKGYSRTIGGLLRDDYPNIDPRNWVLSVYGQDRYHQIEDSLKCAQEKVQSKRSNALKIISKYKYYNDYPKPGVIFQDFFSIIRESLDIQSLFNLLKKQYQYDNIDYVVGPESRGFFGFGLSCFGNYGFIPVRKKDKLPGVVKSITYNTEYSTDTLEISTDIPPGSRVIVFDDLIATGGSLRVTCDLLELSNCVIVDCVVLREVIKLRSVAQDKLGRPYTVLLQD